jgi:hypothetical protein
VLHSQCKWPGGARSICDQLRFELGSGKSLSGVAQRAELESTHTSSLKLRSASVVLLKTYFTTASPAEHNVRRRDQLTHLRPEGFAEQAQINQKVVWKKPVRRSATCGAGIYSHLTKSSFFYRCVIITYGEEIFY